MHGTFYENDPSASRPILGEIGRFPGLATQLFMSLITRIMFCQAALRQKQRCTLEINPRFLIFDYLADLVHPRLGDMFDAPEILT